jgi:transposase, IS5 family
MIRRCTEHSADVVHWMGSRAACLRPAFLRRIAGFRDRSRAAHRRMYEIQRMTSQQRQGIATYRTLIVIAEEAVAAARTALDDTTTMRDQDPLTAIMALRDEISHYCDLGTPVIG